MNPLKITELFQIFPELKISTLEQRSGIRADLLRHYKSGSKKPSVEQLKKIQTAIHELGSELINIQLLEA